MKGFWSLTLYNEEKFFFPNALNRFSLGTKNKTLKYAADGSLTLYLGAKSPGQENEANWIPAPDGHFSLILRLYWPEASVLERHVAAARHQEGELNRSPAILVGTIHQPSDRAAMRPILITTAVCAALILPRLAAAQTAPAIPPSITTPDRVESSIGTLEYKDGAPSKETVAKVYDYLDLMHGVEAFVNAYQGASVAAIFKGMEDAGVPNNTALIFSELMDAKSLFLTANADTVYFWVNLDVTKGPIVVETPPLSLGVIDDMWFQWVTDFGLPGPDRGEGGRYLFVPPDYKGEVPDSGYFVQKMRTTRATMLGRSFLENNDPKPVVAQIKKTLKVYPYLPGGYGTSIGSALQGKATLARTPDHKLDWAFLRPQEPVKFTEGSGKVMNTVPPNDFSYFEMLNDVVQKEPVGALDPEIMGSLAAIGIVKGKPFNPDARMKKILTDAAAIGTAAARTLNWKSRPSEGGYYYPNSAWFNPLFARRLQLRDAAAAGQRGRTSSPPIRPPAPAR